MKEYGTGVARYLYTKETKRLKELKAKIELARFVQDTANAVKTSTEGFEGNFRNFLDQVWQIKEWPSNLSKAKSYGPMSRDQMLNFVKTFRDDLTLSNLKRSQILVRPSMN